MVDLIIGDAIKLRSRRILLGVSGIDAVDTCTLEHDISLELDTAEGRTCIGREEGIPRSAREDDDFACLKGIDGATLGVEFADRLHSDCSEYSVLHTTRGEC